MEVVEVKPDEPVVAELLRACFNTYRRVGVDEEYLRTLVSGNPAVAKSRVLVVEDRGKPLGMLQLVPRRLRVLGGWLDVAGVANVCIVPEARGKRLSHVLLSEAGKVAQDDGYTAMALLAGYGSLAYSVYEGHGFVEVLRLSYLVASKGAVNSFYEKYEPRVELYEASPRQLDELKKFYEEACGGNLLNCAWRDDALWKWVLDRNPIHVFIYPRNPLHKPLLVYVDDRLVGYLLVSTWKEFPGFLEPGRLLVLEAIGEKLEPLLAAMVRVAIEEKARSMIVYFPLARKLASVGLGMLFESDEVLMVKPLQDFENVARELLSRALEEAGYSAEAAQRLDPMAIFCPTQNSPLCIGRTPYIFPVDKW